MCAFLCTSRDVEEERSKLRRQSIATPSDFFKHEISALNVLRVCVGGYIFRVCAGGVCGKGKVVRG